MKSFEHRFELPNIYRPINYESLVGLSPQELQAVRISWDFDTVELPITDEVNDIEIEEEFIRGTKSFRPTTGFHLDWPKDTTELVDEAVSKDQVMLHVFCSSTGTVFLAGTLYVKDVFFSEWPSILTDNILALIDAMSMEYGNDWLDVLARGPHPAQDLDRYKFLSERFVLEEVEIAQLPDLHMAKGSIQRVLHKTAKRTPLEPKIRNFKRVYSMILADD